MSKKPRESLRDMPKEASGCSQVQPPLTDKEHVAVFLYQHCLPPTMVVCLATLVPPLQTRQMLEKIEDGLKIHKLKDYYTLLEQASSMVGHRKRPS